MTDVTGFGLAGHLLEVAKASGLSAELYQSAIPFYDSASLRELYGQFCLPNLTTTNYRAVQAESSPMDGFAMALLCDPQTSGGLLLFVGPEDADAAVAILKNEGLEHACIGKMANFDADQPRLKIVS